MHVQGLPITSEEKKILEHKYAAPRIGTLTKSELDVLAPLLLQRINVVTGWVLPEGDVLKILLDEFTAHLEEKYKNLNSEEIRHAFRMYGTDIKDWGKTMNLNLVDQVLAPYSMQRFELSKIEEQESLKKELPKLPPAPMPDQEIIDYAYDTWIATNRFQFIAVKTYHILRKNGIVPTDDERIEIKSRAKSLVEIMSQEDPEIFRRESKNSYIDSYAKKLFCQQVFTKYRESGEKIIVA